MLGPAIFIGCGGSGNKAVRYIKAAVERRLRRADWTEDLPAAWRFLGIDTPAEQEHAEEIAPLPSNDYLVISQTQSYHEVYQAVINDRRPGTPAYRELVGWQPDPAASRMPLKQGAGAARAIGRMVGVLGLQQLLAAPLDEAFEAAETEQDTLRRASSALSGNDEQLGGKIPPPLVVVLSSMAGGTGAGISLDVVDLVRAAHSGGEHPVLLLFSPDIFDTGPKSSMEALGGNSLAFMSELLNAYWSRATATSPVWTASDGSRAPGRGPHATFLVGRHSTRGTALPDARAVYAVAGEALSNWVVNDRVRTEITSYVTGNWQQASSGTGSAGGYPFARQQQVGAVTSFGAATISLGRDRFEQWAIDGISRGIINLLLDGHNRHMFDLPNNQEEPLQERIERVSRRIAPAIAWGDSSVRYPALEDFANRNGFDSWSDLFRRKEQRPEGVLTAREHYASDTLAKDEWRLIERDIGEQLGGEKRNGEGHAAHLRSNRGDAIRSNSVQRAERVDDIDNRWGTQVLQATFRALSTYTAETSLRIVLEALRMARQLIEKEAAALRSEAAGKRRVGEQKMDVSLDELARESRRRSFEAQHDKFKPHLIEYAKGLTELWWAERYELAANRIMKTDDRLFSQAVKTVDAALQEAADLRDEPMTSKWPEGFPRTPDSIGATYQPTEVELVLENHEHWPKQLNELCKDAQVGHAQVLELQPFESLIYGIVEGTQLELSPFIAPSLGEDAKWSPNRGNRAAIECSASLERIRQIATACFEKGNHLNFKQHVDTGLRSYLAEVHDDGTKVVEHDDRMAQFTRALTEARDISVPLVNLNQQLYGHVFGEGRVDDAHYITSDFPFDEKAPPAIAARAIFSDDVGVATGVEATSILISSRLDKPLHPMFARSFTEPVADAITSVGRDTVSSLWQYRRARRLNQFLPMPPGAVSCMIRGFATGRLCGYITADPREPIRISPVAIDAGPVVRPDDYERVLTFPGFLTSISTGMQVLPALLEGFALALGRVGIDGMASLRPYARLFSLGNEGRLDLYVDRNDLDDRPSKVHDDLEHLIRIGDTNCEKVDEPRVVGGTEAERRASAITYLETNLDAFAKAMEAGLHGHPDETRDKTGIARGNTMLIEIGEEVIAGYTSLLGAIQAAPQAAESVV